MAAHVVDVLRGGGEMADRIHASLQATCVDTKWSIDATECFAKLREIGAAGECASRLTIDQRDGFERAIDDATR